MVTILCWSPYSRAGQDYKAEELNQILDEWNFVYDHVRPHQSLGYLTPMEFLSQWMEESKQQGLVSTM